MPRCIAFLRGINLGNRRLSMARLKALFEELRFADVATFIASGNVIFGTRARDLRALGSARVFPEDGDAGITIHGVFLKDALPARDARKLESIRTAQDEFRALGREYYWLCRVRTSESRVWKHSGFQDLRLPNGTMRNLTSIRKLIAKHLMP